jgi:hypothetical protein
VRWARQDVGRDLSVHRPAPAWRAENVGRKIGGLIVEVKGDFCGQARDILTSARRGEDRVEIGLGGNVCYNPLHNDVDPYALSFAIGSLLNNLHGRSTEPFWHQAYTALVKFVILVHRLSVATRRWPTSIARSWTRATSRWIWIRWKREGRSSEALVIRSECGAGTNASAQRRLPDRSSCHLPSLMPVAC